MSALEPHAPRVRTRLSGLRRSLSAAVESWCFWTAVALPLSYPVLLGAGTLAEGSGDLLLGLLALHLLALLGGRGYQPARSGD